MESPALTMCLAVQKEVIKSIGKNKSFRGRGLLARFLYSVGSPKVGYRTRQTKTIRSSVQYRYNVYIKKLMRIPKYPRLLNLSKKAQSKWDDFYNDIERQMKQGGSLQYIQGWASKLPGAVARIAGLLHCVQYAEKAPNKDVSVNIVNGAIQLGDYFRSHALYAFGLMDENQKNSGRQKNT
jgi:hydrogenase maturation factor